MKKSLRILGLYLLICCVLTVVFLLGVTWDSAVNPWLKEAATNWRWWNYFTSEHAPTVIYMRYSMAWLAIPMFMSAVFTLFLAKDMD